LNSKVLKVAHHGSKNSSSEKFLEKVSPELAVISVGENKYGHPHKETLEILEKYGIRVLRTDLNGDIKIISDGKNIK
jgi:competence protein ComEC